MAEEREKATPDRAQERAAQRGTQSRPESVPDEKRYSREDLLNDSQGLLGVSRAAVAGGLAGSDAQTFTLDQAADLVNDFRTRPAEVAD